jgi:hypothetical protein
MTIEKECVLRIFKIKGLYESDLFVVAGKTVVKLFSYICLSHGLSLLLKTHFLTSCFISSLSFFFLKLMSFCFPTIPLSICFCFKKAALITYIDYHILISTASMSFPLLIFLLSSFLFHFLFTRFLYLAFFSVALLLRYLKIL